MKALSSILFVSLLATHLVGCGNQTSAQQAAALAAAQAAAASAAATGGCVPIQSGTFSFTATGIYETAAVILAGMFPADSTAPGSHGTVVMGGGGVVAGTGGVIQYAPKVSTNGTIQLYGNTSGTSVSGTVQLNQAIIQQILINNGAYLSTSGINTGVNPAVASLCVQSLALDIVQNVMINNTGYSTGYSTGYGQIIQALLYMTLSNGATLGPIPFQ